MIDLLIIAGPTASGKSSIAVECAKRYNGEIISADSMQIYRHLDIGTAKIKPEEMQGIPHHLIDIIDPDAEYSVSDYVSQVKRVIDDIHSRGKLPILCGGTGLYIKALLYGYDFGNAPKDNAIRNKYQRILDSQGKDALYSILKEKAPNIAAEIHPNATKRVIRALEMIDTNATPKKLEAQYNYLMIVLDLDREVLYDRINRRVDNMIGQGLIDETKHVLSQININSQSMQAIGYKELIPYINNEITLDEAILKLKQNTRNYAKRQLTFFRSFKDAVWLAPDVDNILKLVGEHYGRN